jgi:hypothetical protein
MGLTNFTSSTGISSWIGAGGLITILYIAIVLLRLAMGRKRRRKKAEAAMRGESSGRVCRCGYSLQNLEIPRCPECGRAVGFDVSFADLGIDEHDVRRHIQSKRGPRAGK